MRTCAVNIRYIQLYIRVSGFYYTLHYYWYVYMCTQKRTRNTEMVCKKGFMTCLWSSEWKRRDPEWKGECSRDSPFSQPLVARLMTFSHGNSPFVLTLTCSHTTRIHTQNERNITSTYLT